MKRDNGVERSGGWWWLAVLIWMCGVQPAWAVLKIDITKEGLQPLPIALPWFVELSGGNPGGPGENSKRIVEVITNDLERSGLFRPLDRTGFLQEPVALWKDGPSFREWRLLGAEAIVRGAVTQSGNQLAVDVYVHDVFQGAEIGKGKRFNVTDASQWRFLAHRVADEIYTRLTGEAGYFTSRVSFVAGRGKQKWIAVMDQDGANRTDLIRSDNILLTPRFSPNGENLFFLSYETGQPRIFRWELYNGRKTQLSDYPGLNSAPSWSPDGSKMAMTLSKDGNAEIYVMTLSTGALTRFTDDPAIDTSPSWSPDGKRIVFNSNRGGKPQLYIMDANGGNLKRLSFEGNYNSAPSWSPRGDLIAFVQGGGGKFRIAVTDPAGKRVKTLTDSWMDESPVWSPNGRVILYSRQQGDHSTLYTIDLTGQNERVLPIESGVDGTDPSWSPVIR